MRKDIMVDIETLGTKEGSSIFQISAAVFDIKSGEIYDTFDLVGDIQKYEKLNVDGSTLKWWLNTDAYLLRDLLNREGVSEKELALKFYDWLVRQGNKEEVFLWGNGILFDNAKLSSFFCKFNIQYPIHYKNDRDVRTILELASQKSGISEKEIKNYVKLESDVLHDALSDVKRQIRIVSSCSNILY